MLKSLSILILSCFLIACSSTKSDDLAPVLNYIDLTGDKIIGAGDEYWIVTKRVTPRYPIRTARNGVSGCVNIVVGINSEGKVQGYKIESSSSQGIFNNVAIDAIVQWQWKPTKMNTTLQPILTSIRLDFMLKNASSNAEYLKQCPPPT